MVAVRNDEFQISPHAQDYTVVHDIKDTSEGPVMVIRRDGVKSVVIRYRRKQHKVGCPMHRRDVHGIRSGEVKNMSLSRARLNTPDDDGFVGKRSQLRDHIGEGTTQRNERNSRGGRREKADEDSGEPEDEQYMVDIMDDEDLIELLEDDCGDEDCKYHGKHAKLWSHAGKSTMKTPVGTEGGTSACHSVYAADDNPLNNLTTLENNAPGEIDVIELCSDDEEGSIIQEFEELGNNAQSLSKIPERGYSDVFPQIRKFSSWMRDKILPDYKR